MNEIVAYCGLTCGGCPIYLAGRETNQSKKNEMISEIIRTCKDLYGFEYGMEDISGCGGCTSSGGKLFIGCAKCGIRKCASDKHYPNCSVCPDYPCEKLSEIFTTDPSAKDRLDLMRADIVNYT